MSIIESEILVAKIVKCLAQNGVRSVELQTTDFFPTADQLSIDDFMETIRWLRQEGIVRTDEIPRFLFNHPNMKVRCVLTAFGFALLDQKFRNADNLGQAIEKVNASGVGYSNIGDLIGGILGGFTKSIGS